MAEKSKIFTDSNFFIALFNPQDSLQKRAQEISKEIKKQNLKVLISNLIFWEIVTVLSQRAGRKIAISIGEDILKDKNIEIFHINPDLHNLSWKIFKKITKKNMSFVDCSSIAVMDAEGIEKFLTFDQEDFAGLRKKYKFSFF